MNWSPRALMAVVLLVFLAGVGGCLLEALADEHHCDLAEGHCQAHCVCQPLVPPTSQAAPALHPLRLPWPRCDAAAPPTEYIGSIFQPPRA